MQYFRILYINTNEQTKKVSYPFVRGPSIPHATQAPVPGVDPSPIK